MLASTVDRSIENLISAVNNNINVIIRGTAGGGLSYSALLDRCFNCKISVFSMSFYNYVASEIQFRLASIGHNF